MRPVDIQEFIDQRIWYPNTKFEVHVRADDGIYLQLSQTIEGELWRGRKWKLSEHMTPTEIVSTCFKAVMAFMEHEVREQFKYLSRSVFGPHINVDDLWAISTRLDVRD